jgi:hypothetical protein
MVTWCITIRWPHVCHVTSCITWPHVSRSRDLMYSSYTLPQQENSQGATPRPYALNPNIYLYNIYIYIYKHRRQRRSQRLMLTGTAEQHQRNVRLVCLPPVRLRGQRTRSRTWAHAAAPGLLQPRGSVSEKSRVWLHLIINVPGTAYDVCILLLTRGSVSEKSRVWLHLILNVPGTAYDVCTLLLTRGSVNVLGTGTQRSETSIHKCSGASSAERRGTDPENPYLWWSYISLYNRKYMRALNSQNLLLWIFWQENKTKQIIGPTFAFPTPQVKTKP